MTGWEQFTAWMFGIFCVSVAACSVAKSLAAPRLEVARAWAEAVRAGIQEQARTQDGEWTVPQAWTKKDGGQ